MPFDIMPDRVERAMESPLARDFRTAAGSEGALGGCSYCRSSSSRLDRYIVASRGRIYFCSDECKTAWLREHLY